MEELIKLREFCFAEKEKAYQKGYHSALWTLTKPVTIRQRGKVTAFSAVIKQLDLILNNSVVKPSERRSPTDETLDGASRPNERQNPPSEQDNNEKRISDGGKYKSLDNLYKWAESLEDDE